MNTSHQPEVRIERVAHRAAVTRLREVYQQLAKFESKATPSPDEANHVNYSTKEQEVNK